MKIKRSKKTLDLLFGAQKVKTPVLYSWVEDDTDYFGTGHVIAFTGEFLLFTNYDINGYQGGCIAFHLQGWVAKKQISVRWYAMGWAASA